jgi:hypothetical protein
MTYATETSSINTSLNSLCGAGLNPLGTSITIWPIVAGPWLYMMIYMEQSAEG